MTYEGDAYQPLALGYMENLKFQLAVHPATLQLHASLGNLVAQYGALEESNPNRTILTMREGVTGSLIEVTFRCAGDSLS
jgi:hypothetical protein